MEILIAILIPVTEINLMENFPLLAKRETFNIMLAYLLGHHH